MELGKFIPALCMILGLMKPSAAVDSNCNFQQELQPGIVYYVYNPNFPNYYTGQHSCRWKALSAYRVKLACKEMNIPPSHNCSRDALTIQVQNDIEYKLCGLKSFVVESMSTEMVIKFTSQYNTPGGKFRCELTAVQEECNCGQKNPNRIVGGVETGVNEFPMMAGLVSIDDRLLFCGATIVTQRHVVTAAHCITRFVNDINNLAVIVGEHDIKKGNETDATQLYLAEGIAIHPDYIGPTVRADLAVVKSTKKFIFSMKVGPVCLPFNYNQENFAGSNVTALGWGSLSFGGKKSNTLQKVDLGVTTQERCAWDYENITSGKICTYANKKDACQFDSGGPILWQTPQSNRVMLIGVISYGKACADGYPSVNTRVTSYLDFIRAATSEYSYCKVF